MSTRRRAAAAAAADSTPQPLDGYKIVLSGKFNHLGHTQGSLEKLVRTLGGSTSNSVTGTTTHVVCTEFDYNSGSKKIDAAKSSGKPLLDPQWVIDAEGKASAPDESTYSWAARANAPQSNGTDSQKRKQDDVAESQDKKKTRAKAKAKAVDEDGDEEMEDEPQPAKTNGKAKANGKVNGKSKAKAKAEPEEVKEEEEEEEQPKATTRAKGRSKAKAKPKSEEEEEEEKPKVTKAKGKSKAKAKAEPEVKDDEFEEEKVVAEGQFIKKKGIEIPVDSHSPHFFDHKVYVDPDSGMIWDASLNQTNASNNNNKWGRVGEIGQSATLPEGTLENAIKGFEKKFKDKSGLPWEKRGENPKPGKYAFVERSYDDDSDDDEGDADKDDSKKVKKEEDDAPPECTLEEPIQDLVRLIFNQTYFQAAMSSLNYDANKLPLGKLSKATIMRGFQQLKELAALIDDPSLPGNKEQLSNTFYSLIPHAFGRNRPPIISDSALLKKEIELLESLSDMKDAADIMKIDRKTVDTVHPLDRQFQGLGLNEMTTLDHSSVEFNSLKDYLCESRGATHNFDYKVEQIWRIERQGEKDRFDQSEYAKIDSDRRLLWHGSRCTNFGGILSQGLRIAPPEAPVSGYMFGKGIYLADMSSKSAGYCCSYISNGHILLLLCEAELGNPMQTLTQASYQAGETAKQNGMVSTWGQGSTGPSKWVDAGTVHESLKGIKMPDPDVKAGPTNVQNAGLYYNEYICYDVAQVRLRYLFRVKV
ncbi:unnamed protein product [Clonostachys rosea f. rosea IK726]|uniref:Uncharacterized protein n=1 Tax=Clonostachys rosea f. rosea IK726 TaxID=1349383 RepID=A0ACA9TU65_BIOOC|nr:unnamed protein product [Clonostachys rosea f. rosea IK726]